MKSSMDIFWKGLVWIEAKNGFAEEFLNLLRERGISVYRLYRNENCVNAGILYPDLNTVSELANQSGMEITVLKIKGFPKLKQYIRLRLGVPIGLGMALFLFLFLSCFLWRVEITAEEPEYISTIEDCLEDSGFSRGTLLFKVDCRELEKLITDSLHTSGECTVNLVGCRLFVNLKQPSRHEDVVSPTDYGNLIAKKGGEILKIDVYSGTKTVTEGMAVVKNDVLVYGYQQQKDESLRPLMAKARVLARTQNYISCPMSQKVTANVINGVTDIYFPFLFGLGLKSDEKENELKTVNTYLLHTKATEMPIGVVRSRNTKYSTTEIQLSDEQMLLIGITDMLWVLDSQYSFDTITERTTSISFENGLVLDTKVICVEDIAEVQNYKPEDMIQYNN